jgi:hypothetical protein
MKRFAFPLESVRLWRSEQAEMEALKLQHLHRELRDLVIHRETLAAELAAEEKAVLGQETLDQRQLADLDSFREWVRARMVPMNARERECGTRVEVQKPRVMEARRNYELLDRLKKKARTEWQAGVDKEQEQEATELFLAKRQRESS